MDTFEGNSSNFSQHVQDLRSPSFFVVFTLALLAVGSRRSEVGWGASLVFDVGCGARLWIRFKWRFSRNGATSHRFARQVPSSGRQVWCAGPQRRLFWCYPRPRHPWRRVSLAGSNPLSGPSRLRCVGVRHQSQWDKLWLWNGGRRRCWMGSVAAFVSWLSVRQPEPER